MDAETSGVSYHISNAERYLTYMVAEFSATAFLLGIFLRLILDQNITDIMYYICLILGNREGQSTQQEFQNKWFTRRRKSSITLHFKRKRMSINDSAVVPLDAGDNDDGSSSSKNSSSDQN